MDDTGRSSPLKWAIIFGAIAVTTFLLGFRIPIAWMIMVPAAILAGAAAFKCLGKL